MQPFGIEDLFARLQKFRHLLETEHNLGHESMIKLDRVKTSSMNSCQAPMKNTCFGFKLKPKQARPLNAFGIKN